jgi:hypothetical protein
MPTPVESLLPREYEQRWRDIRRRMVEEFDRECYSLDLKLWEAEELAKGEPKWLIW